MKTERLTIFAGHYGSGKTSVALNYALYLRKYHEHVSLLDLDIVNPYYGARSCLWLTERGISLITSEYANSNIDIPALPPQAKSLFDDESLVGIIDLGGDDRGALAIGRYIEHIKNEKSKNILFVVNICRPLTQTVNDVLLIKNEIETAAGFKFTGLVNNSNLGAKTTDSTLILSYGIMDEISEKTKLPIFMITGKKEYFHYTDAEEKIFMLPLEVMPCQF